MNYIYPAIFTQEESGQYSIRFPDLPNCFTGADSLNEGLYMAEDALSLMLWDCEERGAVIPNPSDIRTFTLAENEFATLISCNTVEYARKVNNTPVTKTLTIPAWLNNAAQKEHLDFSIVLQDALKQRLNIA